MPSKITLLQTKMMLPPQAASFVSRSRFVDAFKEAIRYRLISISAPAGFGKTTALAQAIKPLNKKYKTAWISLDARDNQPNVFLQYFVAALQNIDKTLGQSTQQLIEASIPPELTKSITHIINDIVRYKNDFFIILDDFHFIESSKVQEFLEVIINIAPRNFHLIVSSRTLSDFSIITKNARTDTLQMSTTELRFDLQETKRFFKGQKRIDLNDDQLLELYERSEGWAVGLQLAALYLNKLSDGNNKLMTSMGSLRDIADYLAREVLDQQSSSTIEFLIKTSVLQRFNAKASDALLERTDSLEVLRALEESNLFIVPLDQSREWYRYHHFFQEFLQTQLLNIYSNEAPLLLRKASKWFQRNEMFHEAVEYALEGAQYDLASKLIEEHTTEEFVRGRMPQVNKWISRIPSSVLDQHPNLLLTQGTALYHMNQSEEARIVGDKLKHWLADKSNEKTISKIKRKELQSECKILEAGSYMSEDRHKKVFEHMPAKFDPSPSFTLGAANNIIGYAYYRSGHFKLAEKHFAAGRAAHREINQYFGVVYSDCFLAISQIIRGDINSAATVISYLDRTQLEAEKLPKHAASVVDIMRGVIAYEKHELKDAQKLLKLSLPILERVGHIHILLFGYRALIKSLLCKKDFANAYSRIDYVIAFLGSSPQESNRLFIETLRIEAYLLEGRLADALNLATLLNVSLDEELSLIPPDWNEAYYFKEVIKIRILIAADQNDLARQLFPQLLSYLKKLGQNYWYSELLLLQAINHWCLKEQKNCFDCLFSLIHQLAPHDMISLIIFERHLTASFLQKLLVSPVAAEDVVVSQFLGKIHDLLKAYSEESAETSDNFSLVEPLSARELSILKNMGQGKSNSTIAKELFISEGTVKWHAGNIFGKLNVKNRTAAVITAKNLHLLG